MKSILCKKQGRGITDHESFKHKIQQARNVREYGSPESTRYHGDSNFPSGSTENRFSGRRRKMPFLN